MPQQPDSIPALVMRRLVNFAAPPPSPNVDLPPGAPVRSWRDAARDPVSAMVEFLRGAVTGDLPPGPSAQGVGAMLNAAAPFAGAAGVMRKAAMGAEAEAAPALEAIAKRIKAYHGSPHDFDRFSLSKIGTGEGAQAYGHGLYFAENEAVAKQYRDDLGKVVQSFDGVPVGTAAESMAHDILTRSGGDAARALQMVDEWADAGVFRGKNEARAALDVKRAIGANAGKAAGKAVQGRMYEVEINADPDTLLDWDRPLSQQSEYVKQALQTAGVADHANWLHTGVSGREVYNRAKAGAPAKLPLRQQDDQIFAADKLRSAGIPGIKYLDGGSRGAGEGSRNYVIFDDSLISILRKYGVALGVIEGLRRQAASNGGVVPADTVHGLTQQ